jgi:hypothetical protein
MIHLLFPDAPIVHVVRNPMDQLWSCLRRRFGTTGADGARAGDCNESEDGELCADWSLSMRDAACAFNSYSSVMEHWLGTLEEPLDAANDSEKASSVTGVAAIEGHNTSAVASDPDESQSVGSSKPLPEPTPRSGRALPPRARVLEVETIGLFYAHLAYIIIWFMRPLCCVRHR